MDDELRRAERDAASGDPGAAERWLRLCARRGLYFRDHKREEDLTEWEEVQQDYDDLWWQKHGAKRFIPGWFCPCCRMDDWKWAAKLTKAKYLAFRSNFKDNNAKRKTLRTHRDGSRRNYRLRSRKVV